MFKHYHPYKSKVETTRKKVIMFDIEISGSHGGGSHRPDDGGSKHL
jgi:hypothetical protein